MRVGASGGVQRSDWYPDAAIARLRPSPPQYLTASLGEEIGRIFGRDLRADDLERAPAAVVDIE